MTIAYVSSALDVGIDTTWSVLRDFHGMAAWVGRIRSSVAEGGMLEGAVGSIRRLSMDPDGRAVRERLVHYDPPGHRYSYEFVDEIPFPVRSYRGTVHLLPITDRDGTFVEWFGEFDTDAGEDAAQAERLCGVFTSLYRGFIDDLRKHLDAIVNQTMFG